MFKVNARRFNRSQVNRRKGNEPWGNGGGLKRKCFNCGQVRNYKWDCLKPNNADEYGVVFAVSEERRAVWLIDSDATSHMTPQRIDFFD